MSLPMPHSSGAPTSLLTAGIFIDSEYFRLDAPLSLVSNDFGEIEVSLLARP